MFSVTVSAVVRGFLFILTRSGMAFSIIPRGSREMKGGLGVQGVSGTLPLLKVRED